jgi:hypothetical protein
MPSHFRSVRATPLRATILLSVVFAVSLFLSNAGLAQTSTPYFLLPGSQISIQCPVCGIVRPPIPISGTFTLITPPPAIPIPIATTYIITNTAFLNASTNDPPYSVTGQGTYQIIEGILQGAYMELSVTSAIDQFVANATTSTPKRVLTWPNIGFVLDQTNGTAAQQMTLTLLAAPVPKILSVTADQSSASILLTWPTNVGPWRLLRSTNASGFYTPISGPVSNASYTDPGVLTNQPASFYKLINP